MKSSLIDICVTHFGDKYSTKYIDNLEKGIASNYSSDFNFVVKTDCPNQHWDKISFFNTDKPTIVMDIDMLVVGNLDSLFNFKYQSGLAAFQRWWSPNRNSINGGFYKIIPNEHTQFVYDKFYTDPNYHINKYGKMVGTPWKGEQTFVNNNLSTITNLPNMWLGVYADFIDHKGSIIHQKTLNTIYNKIFESSLIDNDKFGSKLKLVHFIYEENMIEDHADWIQDLWHTPISTV